MRTSCLPLFLLALFLFALAPAWAAGELPAEFAEACGPASAKMQEAYEHATIRGNCRLTFPHGNPGATRTHDRLRAAHRWRSAEPDRVGGSRGRRQPGAKSSPTARLEINGREAGSRGSWSLGSNRHE